MAEQLRLAVTVVMDIPFPLEGITLFAFRRLYQEKKAEVLMRYPEVDEVEVSLEFPCNADERIRVCDLPGFVPAERILGAKRVDFGVVERFKFT